MDFLSNLKNEIVEAVQEKLDAKFDETIEKLNTKVNKAESDIVGIRDDVKVIKDDIIDLTARVDTDNEITVDNTERLDKLDKDNKCFEIRLKEAESLIDEMGKQEVANPRINRLEKEVESLKQSLTKKTYADGTNMKENDASKASNTNTHQIPALKYISNKIKTNYKSSDNV